MKSPNLDKYFDLRKKLLDLRSKHAECYGADECIEEDKILDTMDDLWYKHLTDEEREYLNNAP